MGVFQFNVFSFPKRSDRNDVMDMKSSFRAILSTNLTNFIPFANPIPSRRPTRAVTVTVTSFPIGVLLTGRGATHLLSGLLRSCETG